MKFVTLDDFKKHPDTTPEQIEALGAHQYGVSCRMRVLDDMDILCKAIDWCASTFGYECSVVGFDGYFLMFESESDQSYFILNWL